MCIDPEKRATLEEILEHDWIKKDSKMKEKAHKLMYPNGEIQFNGETNLKREYDINANEITRKKFKPYDSGTSSSSAD